MGWTKPMSAETRQAKLDAASVALQEGVEALAARSPASALTAAPSQRSPPS